MSEAPLKATLKGGAGFEAPWITVDAQTPDELATRVGLLAQSDVLATVANVAELFRAAHVAAAGLTPAPQQQAAAATPAQQASSTPPPAGQVRTCPHGVRVRRTGQGRTGPWVGHFCPLPKGDQNQCKAEFE